MDQISIRDDEERRTLEALLTKKGTTSKGVTPAFVAEQLGRTVEAADRLLRDFEARQLVACGKKGGKSSVRTRPPT